MEALETGISGLGASSGRIQRLRESFLSDPFRVDLDRARYYTRVWKEMGEKGNRTPCMRAARALEETLGIMNITIHDDELLVGMKTPHKMGDQLGIERGSLNGTIELLLKMKPERDADFNLSVGGISPERGRQLLALGDNEKNELKEIISYWRDKSLHRVKTDRFWEKGLVRRRPTIGPISLYRMVKATKGGKSRLQMITGNTPGDLSISRIIRALKSLPQLLQAMRMLQESLPELNFLILDMQGHTIPGYRRVFELGFEGIAEWADRSLKEMQQDARIDEKSRDFLESVKVSAGAVCDFSRRYARLAEEMAEKAQGERKAELLGIAERCRRVPAKPPRTFMEAMQSMWMTYVVLAISYGMDNVFSTGRADQYLYPYYKADLESGRITREETLACLEEFMIKLSGNLVIQGPQTLTIGGVDREGRDATNELSYMFLEALDGIDGMGSSIPVRIGPETPREFLVEACRVHRKTAGIAFYNDEVVIRDLVADGYPIEDARDYSIVGCVEPACTGNDFSYTAGNVIMLVGILEMALNKGRRVLYGGDKVGANTPDPGTFTTFEDVRKAFKRQLSFNVYRAVRLAEEKDRIFAEMLPSPLFSSTLEGCLESAQDMTWGGARNNFGHINAQGLATVANSLAAIRWAVYEKKIVTMKELVRHLRHNFQGAENLRQELLRKAPKYGNDDPEADELAEWVAEALCYEVRKYRCWRGGIYRPSLFSSGTQDMEGSICIATPDGRMAGEAVSNGISPANGTETHGATAVFHSAARGGNPLVSDGTALNMNLSPALLSSVENVEKLAFLIEAYFELGGRHVQFNPIDAETMRDAQAHPEKYPSLTVKVTGYSARFVDLSRTLQDDIIARTEFREI